jgi:hypothetical protein
MRVWWTRFVASALCRFTAVPFHRSTAPLLHRSASSAWHLWLAGEHFDRTGERTCLARRDCSHADDVTADLFTAVIANRDDDRILPRLADVWMAD